MSEEKDKKEKKMENKNLSAQTGEQVTEKEAVKSDVVTAEKTDKKSSAQTGNKPDKKDFKKSLYKKNERPRRGRRPQRERREFDQKIVNIRRVTRVVAGGRRFSFSVAIVIGDKKGKVGVGIGKAGDTALAIEKAVRDAKKNMITVRQTKEKSISHDVSAKYCASRITILPAPGRGIVAGGAVRTVLELAGIKDVTAKIFSRSKNHLNNARAAMEALQDLSA